MFSAIGEFCRGVLEVVFGSTTERAAAHDAAMTARDTEPRERKCWFCKTLIRDADHAALPGGQKLWHICKTCTIDAAVALCVQSTLTLDEMTTACATALERRRAVVESSAQAELARIRAAELALAPQSAHR